MPACHHDQHWPQGAFTNYVDKISAFLDHLPTPCWHWWRNSFTVKVENLHIIDISTTTYLPRLFNIVCERPICMYFLFIPIPEMISLEFHDSVCNLQFSKEADLGHQNVIETINLYYIIKSIDISIPSRSTVFGIKCLSLFRNSVLIFWF